MRFDSYNANCTRPNQCIPSSMSYGRVRRMERHVLLHHAFCMDLHRNRPGYGSFYRRSCLVSHQSSVSSAISSFLGVLWSPHPRYWDRSWRCPASNQRTSSVLSCARLAESTAWSSLFLFPPRRSQTNGMHCMQARQTTKWLRTLATLLSGLELPLDFQTSSVAFVLECWAQALL